MDSLLQELNTRFSADNRTLKSIMSLVPRVIVDLPDAASLSDELLFWDNDLPSSDALKVIINSNVKKTEIPTAVSRS